MFIKQQLKTQRFRTIEQGAKMTSPTNTNKQLARLTAMFIKSALLQQARQSHYHDSSTQQPFNDNNITPNATSAQRSQLRIKGTKQSTARPSSKPSSNLILHSTFCPSNG